MVVLKTVLSCSRNRRTYCLSAPPTLSSEFADVKSGYPASQPYTSGYPCMSECAFAVRCPNPSERWRGFNEEKSEVLELAVRGRLHARDTAANDDDVVH